MDKFLQQSNVAIDTKKKIDSDNPRTLHVFENTVPSCKMVTPKGKTLTFIGGKFYTDIQEDIDWLNEEIEQQNPHLRVHSDPNQRTILAEDLDPEMVLRKKHFAEFQAQQDRAMNKDNDMGTSVQGRLQVQTSRDVSSAAGESTSGKTIKVGPISK